MQRSQVLFDAMQHCFADTLSATRALADHGRAGRSTCKALEHEDRPRASADIKAHHMAVESSAAQLNTFLVSSYEDPAAENAAEASASAERSSKPAAAASEATLTFTAHACGQSTAVCAARQQPEANLHNTQLEESTAIQPLAAPAQNNTLLVASPGADLAEQSLPPNKAVAHWASASGAPSALDSAGADALETARQQRAARAAEWRRQLELSQARWVAEWCAPFSSERQHLVL